MIEIAEGKNESIHIALSGGQTIVELVSALSDKRRHRAHFHAAAALGRDASILRHTASSLPCAGSICDAFFRFLRPNEISFATFGIQCRNEPTVQPAAKRTFRKIQNMNEESLPKTKPLNAAEALRAKRKGVLDRLNARIAEADRLIAARDRKTDTRHKIVVGACVLLDLEKNPNLSATIEASLRRSASPRDAEFLRSLGWKI